MDPDIKIGIIQLTSNDNLQDNCNQLDYYFKQCLKDGANFILSPEVSNFISTNSELKKKSIKFEKEDPIINTVKNSCSKFKVWSLIGSVILKIKKCGQEKFVNRSILVDPNGRIIARYDKIHMFDVIIDSKETYKESRKFMVGKMSGRVVLMGFCKVEVVFSTIWALVRERRLQQQQFYTILINV